LVLGVILYIYIKDPLVIIAFNRGTGKSFYILNPQCDNLYTLKVQQFKTGEKGFMLFLSFESIKKGLYYL